MKFIALCSCLFLTVATSFAQPSKHVILISIDGMHPDFYLDRSWPTPNLQILMKEGGYALHMRSVFPSFTYPSHTAMLTGALPERAGIYYNSKRNSDEWNWFTSAIKVPTLWQAIKAKGLTSSAIQWPVSVDPNIDYNIPEIWDTAHPDDRITGARRYSRPGLVEEIEKYATGRLDSVNMDEDFFSLDENAGRMAAYVFRTYKPNFLALHFACVDGEEHDYGRDDDSVRLAVASADRAIGDVLEVVKRAGMWDSTTIIIVGDHGFSDIRQVLRPNAWLSRADVKARFQPAGGSAFLYTNFPRGSVASREETDKVKKILNELPDEYKRLFRVFDRRKLDEMGADSNATLALAATPGIVFSGSTRGDQLTKVSGGHHGYDPNLPEMFTGFIAAGAGINKGWQISDLCVTDIAPLIASLLGLDFTAPDGKLIPGILNVKPQ